MTKRSIIAGIALAVMFILGWKAMRTAGVGGDLSEEPLQALWRAPDFELTAQDGRTMRRSDLLGKVWVVDFIFTRCPGPCPRMTRQLAALLERIPQSDPVRFVSISIDPSFDTPQVLAEYARRFQADQSRWHFLSGPADETVQLVVKGFYTAVQAGQTEDGQPADPNEIVHGTHFLLVDAQGQVRGSYDSNNAGVEGRLLKDIRQLVAEIE